MVNTRYSGKYPLLTSSQNHPRLLVRSLRSPERCRLRPAFFFQRQFRLWPFSTSANFDGVDFVDHKGWARRVEAQNIALFSPSPATMFFHSSLSLGSFRGILVVFEAPGLSCEAPAAPKPLAFILMFGSPSKIPARNEMKANTQHTLLEFTRPLTSPNMRPSTEGR